MEGLNLINSTLKPRPDYRITLAVAMTLTCCSSVDNAVCWSASIPHTEPQTEVIVQEADGFVSCGAEAIRMVLDAFGSKKQLPAESHLTKAMSLVETRNTFEKVGFRVESYRLTNSLSARVLNLCRRLENHSCQAIVLLPAEDISRTDAEVPGHFYVVKSWSNETVMLIDPVWGSDIEWTLEKLISLEHPAKIQFIYSPYDTFLRGDLSISQTTGLILSATLLLLICGLISKPKACVASPDTEVRSE